MRQLGTFWRTAVLPCILCISLIGVCAASAYSQEFTQLQIDSMISRLPAATDREALNINKALHAHYFESDIYRAMAYTNDAHALAVKLNDSANAAGCMMNLGNLYYRLNNMDRSIECYETAISGFEAIGHDMGLSMAIGNLANHLQEKERWKEALDHQRRAMSISKRIDDTEGIAITAIGMAGSFHAIGNSDSAIHYYQLSLKILTELDMPENKAAILGNIGREYWRNGRYEQAEQCLQEALHIYTSMNARSRIGLMHRFLGMNSLSQNRWQEAHDRLEHSLALYQEIGNTTGQAYAWYGQGLVYGGQGKYELALEFLLRALRLDPENYIDGDLSDFNSAVGGAFLDLNQEDSAMHYLNTAMEIAEKNDLKYRQYNAAQNLARAYRKLDDSEKADYYDRMLTRLEEKLLLQLGPEALDQMRADYFSNRSQRLYEDALVQQQQLELERQRSRSQQLIIGLLVAFSLLIAAVLLAVQAHNRAMIRARDVQEKENGLRSLVTADHSIREKVSRELHDGIGQTLTGLRLMVHNISQNGNGSDSTEPALQDLSNRMGEAIEEVRTISMLMMPFTLKEHGLVAAVNELLNRSTEGLTYTFEQSVPNKRFSEALEINVYRIIQELLNNTLKHAGADHITVQLTAEQNLRLTFTDNGSGFDYASARFKGSGLQNIKSRVDLLGGSLETIAAKPQGFTMNITIPIS